MTEWTNWRRTRELLTPTEMARADAAAIAAGMPGRDLMERAGAAVADEAAQLALPLSRATPRVAVLCGPGNNGGDGYVAARLLAARGLAVRVFGLGDRARLAGDAAWAASEWRGPVSSLRDYAPESFDLVVDALFGAGLSRDLDGEARDIVLRVNAWRRASRGKVVAVDVPSGLDGAAGQARGVAIEADSSVTFFRLKPGHVLSPGRQLCGDLRLAQIGIGPEVLAQVGPATFLNGPALWGSALPRLRMDGHKYSRGHALVVSGPASHTGAARLSACAAARIRAGLVTVAGSAGALAEHAAHLTAIMLAPCADGADLASILADGRKNAVVIGPGLGLGATALALVAAALTPAAGRGLVLDADALTLVANDVDALRTRIQAFGGPVVLTPHEGEFARFSKYLSREVESDSQPLDSKLSRARKLASATGAIVLLKGPDTVVAAPDGRASIATELPRDLATAGSGDVLAGMIGGLLAQGMPAFEAASAAVWLHGRAGDIAGRGLTADDLPGALAQALLTVDG
ncbi:MAG: carbohydrate kinase, YjeF related protein [Hyphomicrobiales bacterium]|nr:carbohydrate kinase, YjeF related protein [Hyphomicrobiales bacterium]